MGDGYEYTLQKCLIYILYSPWLVPLFKEQSKTDWFRPSRLIQSLATFFKSAHRQQSRSSVETMVFGTVFSMGGSNTTGSSVAVTEATEEQAAVTSPAKDRLRDGGRDSKFGFIRNLPFLANIRQRDAVGGGTAGSNEAPHDPADAFLSKGTKRVAFRYLMGENGPLTAPPSHVPSESDIDSSAAVLTTLFGEVPPVRVTKEELLAMLYPVKDSYRSTFENEVLVAMGRQ
jgi:hypothetical protein